MEELINWRLQKANEIVEIQNLENQMKALVESNFLMSLQKETFQKQINKEKHNDIEEKLKEKIHKIFRKEPKETNKEQITDFSVNELSENLKQINRDEVESKILELKNEFCHFSEKWNALCQKAASHAFYSDFNKQFEKNHKDKEVKLHKYLSLPVHHEEVERNMSIANQISQNSLIKRKIMETENAIEGEIKKLQHLLLIEQSTRNLLNELLDASHKLISDGFWHENSIIYEPSEFETFTTSFTII